MHVYFLAKYFSVTIYASPPTLLFFFFLDFSFFQNKRAQCVFRVYAFWVFRQAWYTPNQPTNRTKPNQSVAPILNHRSAWQLARRFGQLFIFIVHLLRVTLLSLHRLDALLCTHQIAQCGLLIWNWCFRCHTTFAFCPLLSVLPPFKRTPTVSAWNAFSTGHKNNVYWVKIQTKLLFNIHLLQKNCARLCIEYRQWKSFSRSSAPVSVVRCQLHSTEFLTMHIFILGPIEFYFFRLLLLLSFENSEAMYVVVSVLTITCVYTFFIFNLSFTWRYLWRLFYCVRVCVFFSGWIFSHTLFIIFIWMVAAGSEWWVRENALHQL